MEPLLLIGGGGHCKACIDVIEQTGAYKIVGIVDLPAKFCKKILGYEVIGSDDDLQRLINKHKNCLITIGQIRSPDKRITIFKQIKSLGASLPVIISPLAYVSKHTVIEEGTIIMHHAVVNAGVKIGKNCIVNTRALVEHDAVIRDNCHISTGALINGSATISQNTFIGSGAIILQDVEIGKRAIVGAGAVVHTDLSSYDVVAGVPAKALKS